MNRRRIRAGVLALSTACSVLAVASTSSAVAVDDATLAAREVIVRIDPAVTDIDAVNAAAGTSAAAASVSGNGSYLLMLPPAADGAVVIDTITALPGVNWVVPNATITPPEVDATRIYAWRIYAWSIDTAAPAESTYASAAVDLAAAQRISEGAGVVVAVLDTGAQLTHPALAGSIIAGTDLVDGDQDPSETLNGRDDDGDGRIDEGAGHGTHVAGVVHQVAPQASIMPVRVLDDDGTGTVWNATEGMYWAAAHGARVVNMSLGMHGSARPLRDAVAALASQNIVVVAAAGNDGKNTKTFPAAAPEAIAVGSVGAGDVVSTFSNVGRWIDVVAPGENIHSTYAFPADSYAMNSGTSMATPWVAGEAALIASHDPRLDTAGITNAIKAGATNVDGTNPSFVGLLGAGRVDMLASLRAT
jgi:thermitase